MVREVKLWPNGQGSKITGELDTTDTHTDARSAKKDVISTKHQKAMGAERTFPREHKEKSTNRTSFPGFPRQMPPFSGHAILCKQGRWGRGALPLV